ncbi:MAG: CoB--CoM heterodisulfide reductase iron-sulfur subunit A family protein [candidate division Zixibacteria bacterium]|nr:CoB--CoM heterodisulfide reductase iron-sulfur subunit A family protein [candidate division Zixibacteria bacterium]
MSASDSKQNGAPKIGVYVCHCGINIAGKIDVAGAVEFAKTLPNVTVAREYKFICSDPGQELIQQDIRDGKINRVVVASCSPLMHENTFRKATKAGGENPYFFQMANIREHVSWVTTDKAMATIKAKALIAGAVHRVAHHKSLERTRVPVNPDVLVVGGGIAGIHAALTLADSGKKVYLVEREPTIGGHMAQFDKTFPTLDCAACILTPKMSAVRSHPNIILWSYSEVSQVEGYVGNFKVKVRRKPRYVDETLCVGCYECIDKCIFKKPKFPDEFNQGLNLRKPVYIPFPQATPLVALIDPETCAEFRGGKCKKTCAEACERNAIDFNQKEEIKEIEVGAIILATGYKTFDAKRIPRYGYGKYPNVYTAMEVERLVNASGPTGGEVLLRDGKKPKSVAVVHCVGSRDENTNRYCSRVCCMASLKLAHLIHERTEAEVYNFYIDMRAAGKGYEEFYDRLLAEGVHFIRGRVAEISDWATTPEEEGKLIIRAEDTLIGVVRRIPVDMVVLATGLEAQADAEDVRRVFNISCGAEGWFLERHPKLAPVSTFTDGVSLAGACQGPKDIPDTVAQAGAAAAEALALIDKGFVELEPNTAYIQDEFCSGCKTCIGLCPYSAISFVADKNIASVNGALCKGCGTCVAACPSGALQQNLFTDEQIYDEIKGVISYV